MLQCQAPLHSAEYSQLRLIRLRAVEALARSCEMPRRTLARLQPLGGQRWAKVGKDSAMCDLRPMAARSYYSVLYTLISIIRDN
jgi:hypothetical protein